MSTTLQRRLETLYGLERRKDKLGLDGTRALLGALGNPERRFRSVHVAGTNGKGSVCALVERALREAGYRTGLYTSPHLVDFRERIRVRGRWVDQDWLESALDRIEALPEGRDRTFFEVATALGFLYFAEREVEIAVVEVGLGGRLDCTNVIVPEVSVITSVGLDHTEILGRSLEEIAAEKGGIVKPGVPLVSGVGQGPAARVLEAIREERGSPLFRLGGSLETGSVTPGEPTPRDDFASRRSLVDTVWGPRVELPNRWAHPYLAAHQLLAVEVLACLASGGMEIPWASVRRGMSEARWPGRLERCPGHPRLWWDGAHNVDGALWLRRLWREPRAPGAIVLALSRDKDVEGFVRALRRYFPQASLVATRSRSERAMEPSRIAAQAAAAGFEAREAGDVRSAVHEALAAAGDAPVLLTGSLFAIGEAMQAFGGAPGEML